jgi:hypothetical protein
MQTLQSGPATGPVTDTERAYALDILRTTRTALHAAVADLTEAQLNYKPAPDRWSIAENVEHIGLVEKGIFGGILKGMSYPANPDKRAELQHEDLYVVKAVRSRTVTFPAPDPFVPTGRFAQINDALAAFDTQREIAIEYAQIVTDDLRTHYFRHPALGWIDCFQAILLLASHSERHRKQIEEIKASAGYPA